MYCTPIKGLICAKDIAIDLRNELLSVYRALNEIEEIKLNSTVFSRVQLYRNNSFYSFLINVCEMIYNMYLVSEDQGESKFRDFLRDRASMARLFEEFVRNFYKKELLKVAPEYKVIGTEIYETYVMGTRYARYENRDYGNIKGITLSINKRPAVSDYLIASLDYTYQAAEGNASDPNQSFYNSQSDPPKPNNIQVVPLDWDQRHTVNLSLSYSNPKLLCVGLIGQFQSGLPYTPAIQSKETTFENSGRKPFNYNIDLRFSKAVDIWKLKLNIFFKIYNLFDSKNELTVYSDTGRAGYSLVSHYAGDRAGHVNTMEEWISRPDFYSEPRKVLIGFTVSL